MILTHWVVLALDLIIWGVGDNEADSIVVTSERGKWEARVTILDA